MPNDNTSLLPYIYLFSFSFFFSLFVVAHVSSTLAYSPYQLAWDKALLLLIYDIKDQHMDF